MKKIIRAMAIYGALAVVSVFANVIELRAQTPATSPAATQNQCTDEIKNGWYSDFTKLRTTEPPKAYEASKRYLGCSQTEDQYTTYLKKWNGLYEKELRRVTFQPLLYGDKKYAEAFAAGKQILADEPDNLRVIIDLGYSGFHMATPATKNDSFLVDSLNYSRRAIQLIESGKVPESLDGKAAPWAPFKGKDDTLAYLYHGVGRMLVKSNPTEALRSLIKALQYDTDLKKEPWEYYWVAAAYETGPYPKLAEDYKKFLGKEESPESKLLLANINQIIDRMIDAYARAVALTGTDAKFQAQKKDWTEALATWYKFRNNSSDAGMNELIASVLSKPLPPEPTPLTTLPAAPATSTTPTSGNSTTAGSNAAPGTSTPSATNKPATTTPAATNPKATTPETASTKPGAKPKTRNNHRRN